MQRKNFGTPPPTARDLLAALLARMPDDSAELLGHEVEAAKGRDVKCTQIVNGGVVYSIKIHLDTLPLVDPHEIKAQVARTERSIWVPDLGEIG